MNQDTFSSVTFQAYFEKYSAYFESEISKTKGLSQKLIRFCFFGFFLQMFIFWISLSFRISKI